MVPVAVPAVCAAEATVPEVAGVDPLGRGAGGRLWPLAPRAAPVGPGPPAAVRGRLRRENPYLAVPPPQAEDGLDKVARVGPPAAVRILAWPLLLQAAPTLQVPPTLDVVDEVDARPVGAPAHEHTPKHAHGAGYPRPLGRLRAALADHARVVAVVEVAALLAAAPRLRRVRVARSGVLLLDVVAAAVLLPPRRAPLPLLA